MIENKQMSLETELKGQREILTQTLGFMEKRFEQVDKRFEQVDKRFEQVDKRFEQVDKRFEQVDKRFEELLHYMDKRFEQIDKRFEEMLHYMDKRFEQVDRRFESVEGRLINIEKSLRTFIYSSFSFTAAAAGVIIAVLKLT